jgi:hypothetical protein
MIKYRKGYKYQLVDTYRVQVPIRPSVYIKTEFIDLTASGILIIKRGYAWDGPSGPTIDTKSSMRGALVHDALYQLLREGHLNPGLRPKCDDIAYGIWVSDGMFKWRARLWRRELGKFAGFAADPRNKKKVYEAP